MENKKQSSIEWLIGNAEDFFGNLLAPSIIEQAKAKHEEEQKSMFECGRNFQLTGEGTFTEVYNETFGGTMSNREEIKNNLAVSSRLKHITNETDIKIVDFIIGYSFKDSKEVYTNGTVLVPLFRVLDAIEQKGNQYKTGGEQ